MNKCAFRVDCSREIDGANPPIHCGRDDAEIKTSKLALTHPQAIVVTVMIGRCHHCRWVCDHGFNVIVIGSDLWMSLAAVTLPCRVSQVDAVSCVIEAFELTAQSASILASPISQLVKRNSYHNRVSCKGRRSTGKSQVVATETGAENCRDIWTLFARLHAYATTLTDR